VLLRKPEPVAATFVVHCNDGSAYMAKTLTVKGGSIVIETENARFDDLFSWPICSASNQPIIRTISTQTHYEILCDGRTASHRLGETHSHGSTYADTLLIFKNKSICKSWYSSIS